MVYETTEQRDAVFSTYKPKAQIMYLVDVVNYNYNLGLKQNILPRTVSDFQNDTLQSEEFLTNGCTLIIYILYIKKLGWVRLKREQA